MPAASPTELSRFPEWRALLGFMSEPAALSYTTSQGVPMENTTQEEFRTKVRAAIAFVHSLADRSAVKPEIKPLPAEARARTAKLEAEPSFQLNLMGSTGHEWGLVEISKVRCFQSNLNIEYVHDLEKRAPGSGNFANLHAFCQPLQEEGAKSMLITGFNPTTNTFTVVSENLDLRIIGQVQGEGDQAGMKGHLAGFLYGFGLRQLTVAEYKGMYILKNGYHRAYALLERGVTHIPALIVHADSYQSTGATNPGTFPVDLVLSGKPPIMQDYTSKAAVDVPRRRIRMLVSVHAEVQIVAT